MKIKFDFNKIIGYFNLDSERGLFINSFRDWKVLLIGSSIFLILVFAVDVYSLLRVRNEMDLAVQATKDGKELKIDEVALDGVLRDMSAKAENFRKNYVSSPVSTSTPVR